MNHPQKARFVRVGKVIYNLNELKFVRLEEKNPYDLDHPKEILVLSFYDGTELALEYKANLGYMLFWNTFLHNSEAVFFCFECELDPDGGAFEVQFRPYCSVKWEKEDA